MCRYDGNDTCLTPSRQHLERPPSMVIVDFDATTFDRPHAYWDFSGATCSALHWTLQTSTPKSGSPNRKTPILTNHERMTKFQRNSAPILRAGPVRRLHGTS